MKITTASDDVIEYVSKIFEQMGLNNYVEFRVLNNESQKCLITSAKASGTVEHFAKASPCVVVYVNEELWYLLDDDEKREMLVKDALNGVYYDTEKEKLFVEKPQINVSLGTWQKYGIKLLEAAETVVLMQQQIEEKKKEEREAKKKAKK